jgi:hypothetical protein
MFTDVDLAKRFIEDAGWPNVRALEFQTAADLLSVVEHFQNARKVQNVAIDISFRSTDAHIVFPIGEFIQDIRRGDA